MHTWFKTSTLHTCSNFISIVSFSTTKKNQSGREKRSAFLCCDFSIAVSTICNKIPVWESLLVKVSPLPVGKCAHRLNPARIMKFNATTRSLFNARKYLATFLMDLIVYYQWSQHITLPQCCSSPKTTSLESPILANAKAQDKYGTCCLKRFVQNHHHHCCHH